MTQQSFVQLNFWMPTLPIGVWIGAHGFRCMDQTRCRRRVLIILIALAVLGAGKAFLT